MPKVSVVVATYRRDDDLFRALESIATQTYDDYEIVLVDDNDNLLWNEKVEKIVNEFTSRHTSVPITYIQNHPNKGSAETRNVGIEVAKSEYICFLDDDDLYLPERISNQLIPMQRSNADYSVTNLALYSETGKLIEERKREYIEYTDPEHLFKYHFMYHITGTDTMMFRREYLLKIGSFSRIDVGDEFYLMQKAIDKGGKFLHVPVCDVKAYVHTGDGGLSSGQGKIDGENELFKYKQRYFDRLDLRAKRYIKMRHYAVLAFAYLRVRKYCEFFKCGVISFLIYPKECLALFFKRK